MADVWIWAVFLFAAGCCVGSFLNVVIYRMPREESLISPGSRCPSCHSPIRFYDNIPLISWLALKGRCRNCGALISIRYLVIELLTGLIFLGLFLAYFVWQIRNGLGGFLESGWFIYLLHIAVLAALLAASAIDIELWIIPLGLCWFITVFGVAGSAVGRLLISPEVIRHFKLLPTASAGTAALAAGAALGLGISMLLLAKGIIRESYRSASEKGRGSEEEKEAGSNESDSTEEYNHRIEALREIVFLLPVLACAVGAFLLYRMNPAFRDWWLSFSQVPVINGLAGSLAGYFIGGGTVWAARIFGTLAFGKEAMGLGDVHLLAAAGTVTGPMFGVIAFFIAPFFGLAWALYQMFFKKTRQIPYGPFLSLAVFAVIIFHDQLINRFAFLFVH